MKYKRLIAGILAVTMIASSILNGSVEAIASNADRVTQSTETVKNDQSTTDDITEAVEKSQEGTQTQEQANDVQDQSDNIESEEQPVSAESEENVQTVEDDGVQVQSLDIKLTQLNFYSEDTDTITISEPGQLILLSNLNQSKVAGVNIYFGWTGGGFDITDSSAEKITAEQYASYLKDKTVSIPDGLRYQGIGNAEHPFNKILNGSPNLTITADHTIFGGLASSADIRISGLSFAWKGNNGNLPMFADTYVFDSNGTHTIPFTFSNGNGPLLGTVKVKADNFKDQTLTIGNVVTSYNYVDAEKKTIVSSTDDAGIICGSLQDGYISLEGYTFPSGGFEIDSTAGNAGGLIGKMSADTKVTINDASVESLVASSATKIKVATTSSTGNAGGLVGVLNSNAQIIIYNDSAIKFENVTVSGATTAGCVAGTMMPGAQISIKKEVTFDAPTVEVTGAGAAGGIAGSVENVTFANLTSTIEIKKPSVSGGKTGANVGGFIGDYVVAETQSFPEKIEITEPTVWISGSQSLGGGNAGGYFGTLTLKGVISYTIGSDLDNNKKDFQSTYKPGNAQGYGSIAGQLITTDAKSSLKIQNLNITSESSTGARPVYHGGLIGRVGNNGETVPAYLEVNNVDLSIKNPHAGWLFGGVTAYLTKGSILKVCDVSVDTSSSEDKSIWEGAGILGHASEGSALELSGTTDLTKTYFQGSDAEAKTTQIVAQLVRENNGGLIYARGDGNGNGWTYNRSTFSVSNDKGSSAYVNDIGNYGQVIRLKDAEGKAKTGLSSDLITITDDHTVQLKDPTNKDWSSDTITLSSEDDFALLSIAWNSRGYFRADSSITTTNWNTLYSKNITLSNNIDLTGTGISGLTRDNSDEQAYTGTLSGTGKNCTLTIAVGETFGLQNGKVAEDEADGCGKVYAYSNNKINGYNNTHNYQGIFAKMQGNVENLTIAGTMNVSNAASNIVAGGIAAEVSTSNITQVKKVKATETILADAPKDSKMSVGGLYGYFSSGSGDGLVLGTTDKKLADTDSGTSIAATIEVKKVTSDTVDTKVFAGSAIGEAAKDGTSSIKLQCNDLTIGGTITSEMTKRAYVGGLIGVVNNNGRDAEPNRWIEVRKLEFNDFTITAKDATEVCGGLFGSVWAGVGVYFEIKEGNNTDATKLTVTDATINAPKAQNVGGLAYHSSGVWEIQSHGINMQKFTISAGDNLGLLICHGERSVEEQLGGNDTELGGLYLNTTKHWSDSYVLGNNVTITKKDGVFDEFVAFTAEDADSITANRKNAVVSIATKEEDGKRVGVDAGTECTTYINRTQYGKLHQTNSYSRYYYDLDKYVHEASADEKNGDGLIDTEQELLLWSVYRYACRNIRDVFWSKESGTSTGYEIKDIKDIYVMGFKNVSPDSVFNMEKYSYYPVNLDGGMTVKNVTIKFYNQEIEAIENNAGNKNTSVTDDSTTQHYTMHSGLFLSHANGKLEDDKENQGSTTNIYVDTVTFQGSIGKLKDGSGALFAGYITGSQMEQALYRVNLGVKNLTLDGLVVTNCGDDEYAPALINKIGSYTTTSIQKVSTKGYIVGKLENPVASSLIGRVGASDGKQISLAFLDISLPDKQYGEENGIFTHSTLLESFQYEDASCVGTYNFYKVDDWNEDGTYSHGNTTYGKEIADGTKEYKTLQDWYYDEVTYHSGEGKVKNNTETPYDFSGYLPYVYYEYDSETGYHEIKVNQRLADITEGCGTYGHPYEITSDFEMATISQYLSSGKANNDWRITITKDQNDYCINKSLDITYQYDGESENWIQVQKAEGSDSWTEVEGAETLKNATMLQYMLSAYYYLEGTEIKSGNTGTGKYQLVLNDFSGFGTDLNPFRGVLVSNENTTVKLTGSSSGLVGYSYGSVLKDINIIYEGKGKTLSYSSSTTKNSSYYPTVSFGGVIGYVLGGDNIIDNVQFSAAETWNLTLSGDKSHLIPVGGYIGVVCGGGVIFRNMESGGEFSGLSNTMIFSGESVSASSKDLYVNPYVGRVLDGYAFYETNKSGEVLKNTNKNYKINTIDNTVTSRISDTNEVTVNVNNAQELLILSAIVNSGATSGGASNAYSIIPNSGNKTDGTLQYTFASEYGKVRNASYSHIGTGELDDEAKCAINDDRNVVGETNLPYLITKYGDAKTFSISDDSEVTISLSGSEYDMSDYQNGYQGIGARYVSNAIRGKNGNIMINIPSAIVPNVKELSGVSGGSTLNVDMQVKEYADDDFHAVSIGGIFNALRVSASGSAISNVKLYGKSSENKATVSLAYCNAAGTSTDVANWDLYKDNVGVGGFVGTTSSITANNISDAKTVTFSNVELKDISVTGPVDAGGLLGSSGRKSPNKRDKDYTVADIALLLQPGSGIYSVGITVSNSSYDDISVQAKNSAGGFVGYVADDADKNPDSFLLVESGEKTVGKGSHIGLSDYTTVYAGGAFGYIKTNMYLNADNANVSYGTAVMEDVNVYSSDYAGGFIGKIDGRAYQLKNATYKNVNGAVIKVKYNSGSDKTLKIGAGGIAGFADSNGESIIESCKFINAQINMDDDFTINNASEQQGFGGIIGVISGSSTQISNCEVLSGKIYGSVCGGIAGNTLCEATFDNCTVEKNTGSSESTTVKGYDAAGAILGFIYTNSAVHVQNSYVSDCKIYGKQWGAALLIGDSRTTVNINVFDTSVQQSSVTGVAGGQWTVVGGITGNLRGDFTASNILLSDITITNSSRVEEYKDKKGILFGNIVDSGKKMHIAGISIQNVDNELSLYPGENQENEGNWYIAFADYLGKAETTDKQLLGNNEKNETTVESAVAPSVVTSPLSELHVSAVTDAATGTASDLYLYGDGASWEDSTDVNAKKIYASQKNPETTHYPYKRFVEATDDAFNFDIISTYKANQPETKVANDFPVLQITNSNVSAISKYLDILTNGGFLKANTLNSSNAQYVFAKTTVYKENEAGTGYEKSDDSAAIKVNTASDNRISFSTTSEFDNTKNQFTLLTVTFKESGHYYNVHVPIIVRRMLEIDFKATLSYGTNFKSTDYDSITAHVLENYGNSITGYLKYTYGSKEGEYVEYGWQSYVDTGGDMTQIMEKSVVFSQGANTKLPSGTQLSLIDPVDGRVYYKTLEADSWVDGNGNISIPFHDFKNSAGESYTGRSIGEVIGLKESSITDSGDFIEVTEAGAPIDGSTVDGKTYTEPTVKIKVKTEDGYTYKYYRRAEGTEKGEHGIDVGQLYSGTKSNISESYYLVITLPKNSDVTYINGHVATSIKSKIPNQIHYRVNVLNSEEVVEDEDTHNNTASTYQLSEGYKQELDENIKSGKTSKKLSVLDSKMQVDVVDKITFSNSQNYQEQDELYQRFVGRLQNTVGTTVTGEEFPVETKGMAYFYVYSVDDNGQTIYYQYADGKWEESGSSPVVATSYLWTSNGGNMELPLADANGNISLRKVRDLIKKEKKDGESSFYVEAKMTIELPQNGLNVIPQSTGTSDTPENYTKFVYSAQVSTLKDGLSYSPNRATLAGDTYVAYYRDEVVGAKLTYEADKIDQLGINLLDLQYLDATKEHALIDTTAKYDMSALKELDSILANSDGIRFTVQLQAKQTDSASQEEYGSSLALKQDGNPVYLEVEVKSKDSGEAVLTSDNNAYSWTVPSETYWDSTNNKLKTSDIFDGTELIQAIQLKVDVKNVEQLQHLYSNYRVVLTAEIINKETQTGVTDTNASDNIIYTLAKIKLQFQD